MESYTGLFCNRSKETEQHDHLTNALTTKNCFISFILFIYSKEKKYLLNLFLLSSVTVSFSRLTATWLLYSLFVEEVKSLGLFGGELGEGATPLHQAARGVVLDIGLGVHLLHGGGAGGGAEQSAEAAGGVVTGSQEGDRADRSAGKKQGTGSPTNQRQPRNHHHVVYSDIKHAGSHGVAEQYCAKYLSCIFSVQLILH